MSREGERHATSVDKALVLLEEIVLRGEVRVHEAATFLGVARSTAHRLLTAFVRHGFVKQRSPGGPYVPVITLDRPTIMRVTRASLVEAATPAVRALRDEIEETVHLAVLQGNSTRFMLGFEGLHENHTPLRVGQALPAHATAVGKAILAVLPPDSLHDLYPRGVQVLTGATLGTTDQIIEHLQIVARRGYATNVSESESGLTAVGVVVRNPEGMPVGGLGTAGPMERLPTARIPHLVSRMQRAALDVQAALIDP